MSRLPLRPARTRVASGAVLLLLASLPQLARAQEELLPVPYSEDGRSAVPPAEESPAKGTKEGRPDRNQTYATSDDPATGVGAELVGGLVLLDGSRGQGTEARATLGARATWDFGRLMVDPVLHEGLFLDLTYLYTGTQDGTQAINVATALSNITVAPAFELPFGEGSAYGAYVQAGVGLSLDSTTLHASSNQSFSGSRPLIQYGVGLRGRPLLSEDGRTRLTFRVEVTRFRRGYLNDTLFLGSLGLAL